MGKGEVRLLRVLFDVVAGSGGDAAGVLFWLLVIAGFFIYRRTKKEGERAAARAAEEQRRIWREIPLPEGPYSVTLTAFDATWTAGLVGALHRLAENPSIELDDGPETILRRVAHIRPETIATGIQEADAISIKMALESTGARVRIVEERPRTHREAIPERVRKEVWNRSEGKCVDCGSRERLEYDHIIPLSRGGSNTARNLELRCQTCNRKKAAKI